MPCAQVLSFSGKTALAGNDKTLKELGISATNCDLVLTDTDAASLGNTVFDEVLSTARCIFDGL